MNSPLQAPRFRAAARRVKAGGERFLGGVLPGATARRLQTAAFADEWSADNLDARQATGPLWIVLGDSASQGIGATRRESGYVGVMHEMLRRRDAWRVINLSRAGAGVLDVLARQLPELASLITVDEPALVTCLIGAEDMARRTPGLDAALRQVISSLPTGSVIGLLPHGPRTAGALNSVIREEAERHAMRIAVLPPRLPGMRIGRDGRFLDDVGHAAWARAVLAAADGPIAVAAPATDPRLPVVPPLDTSPPTDPRLPVVPALDTSPRTDPRLPVVPAADSPDAAGDVDDAAMTDRLTDPTATATARMTEAELAAAAPAVAEAERRLEEESTQDGVDSTDGTAAEEPAAVVEADEPVTAVDEPATAIDEPADETVVEPVREDVDAPAAEPVTEDKPAALDTPSVLDAPTSLNSPSALDTPSALDAPSALDEPSVEEAKADRDEPVFTEPVVDDEPVVVKTADPAAEAPPADPAPFGGFGTEPAAEPTVEERTFTAPSWYPSPAPRPFESSTGDAEPATDRDDRDDRDEARPAGDSAPGAEVERVDRTPEPTPERATPAPDAEVDLFAPSLPRAAEDRADELTDDEHRGGNGRPRDDNGGPNGSHDGTAANGQLNGRAEHVDR